MKERIVPKTIVKPLPVMGIEADQLLAGTAGKGVTGGKDLWGLQARLPKSST